MSNIIIKKGSINLELKRSDLVEVHETNDGLSFNCKYGIHIYLTDIDMPNGTKNLIRNTANSFEGKKIMVDLNNYVVPATVDAL